MREKRSKAILVLLLGSVLLLYSAFPVASAGQVRAVNDYGALGIGRLLRKLNTTASVMMIGAHPDDEDSSLLAYLARGENARTAYLSLTRGDGGQNIIGPELFESLGVIRTEELLQARRLDGAEQYFARAFDYGFSKSLAEAKQKWDERIILCDVVHGIRSFRPMVVLSRFSGTPSDGHGQHQYSGYITPLAVKAAADPAQCTQSGTPWQVKKFYKGIGAQPTLRINTGQFDPMLGRGYSEIAIEGRSLHRSQGEGRIEPRGDQFSSLTLVESTVPKVAAETSIFDGIDTTLNGVIKEFVTSGEPVSESTKRYLATAQSAAEKARNEYDIYRPEKILPTLMEGKEAMDLLFFSYIWFSGPDERREVFQKRNKNESEIGAIAGNQSGTFSDVIRKVIGLQIDALSDTETVVAGESFNLTARVYFPKNPLIEVKKIEMQVPGDWKTSTIEDVSDQSNTGNVRREVGNASSRFQVSVPANAKPTQPYWLGSPRDGDLFHWANDAFAVTRPFDFQRVFANVFLNIGGKEIVFNQPVEYRFADSSRGEIRREINVVPALSVSVDQRLIVVPQSDKPQTRKLGLSVTNNSAKPITGVTALSIERLPKWDIKQTTAGFMLKTKGENAASEIQMSIPAKPQLGTYYISPNASSGDVTAEQTMTRIAYPHIQTHRYYTRAETKVEVLDLKVAPVKVGYIMGSGDEVPEAIRQMGLALTLLDEKDVASGDLSKFDTIVVGIRAAETRPDLVANNGRILDYARNGGNVIVQYQRGNWTALAPFPVTIADTQRTAAGSIARVVDENAKVNILDYSHPVFTAPNKITDADFGGWVQERNAYNLVTFDPQFTPLLESHDEGEAENKGGLVMAQLGKGTWTYCSYSFFRQLPNGVGGAYRLFANLLSLPKAQKAKAAK